MKTTNVIVIASAISLLSVTAVSAQRGEMPRHPDGCPVLAALDLNGDGVLSTEEIGAAPESLAVLDVNGDGEIGFNELRPAPFEGRGRGAGPRFGYQGEGNERPERGRGPLIEALDVDGDGVLSAEEIADSWKNLLDIDADGDGVISAEELRPVRPERAGGGQMRGQGQGQRQEQGPRQGAGFRRGAGPQDGQGAGEGTEPRPGRRLN